MSESSDPAPKYRIRPGTFFDVPATTRIYAASFSNEPLIDFFFPTRRQDPLSFFTWSCRRFQRRYWTPGYSLSVVVDKHDHPVGLSWWKRPTQPLTLLQKLLSPSFWMGSVVNAFIDLQEYLFPVQGLNKNNMETFEKAFSAVEPHVLDTPIRQKAHYLSLLGVDPVLQGEGLGKMLLEDGLEKVDDADSAAWLVSLAGLEKLYARYGFVEATKVEVEGLHDWKGAHSSTVATNDPIHGFPTSIINKLVDLDDERIKNMDENNVAIQVLSHTPANFLTTETIIACNDELAAAVRANKSRFAGFACLPMGDPMAATHELERCIKEHGFVGALIDNHSNGNFYDGPEYDILWAKAVELDVPIYIHPAWPSEKEKEALYSGGNLQSDSSSATALGAFAFGWHASTANTILRLMASNTFDRHPKLKIIIGHSGELIPYMFDRINKATTFFGMERGFAEVMHNNIWITTSGMFDVHSLRCLLGNMPLSQVMFSVDYPFSGNRLGKEYLETIRREGVLDENGIEAFASDSALFLFIPDQQPISTTTMPRAHDHFHGRHYHAERTTGPVKALNPTKRYLVADKKTLNAESDAGNAGKESRPGDKSPGVAYVWRSRDNRKGRHALAIGVDPHKHAATKGPRPSNTYHQTLRGILKMFVRCPVWDVSYDVAVVFTIGSIIWVINGFYSWLPVLNPSTKVSDWAGGLTAFIGATVFEFGSFLLMLEAVNENRSDCFGWAVEESVDGMLHLTHAHNCKHAHAQKGTFVKQSSKSLGNDTAESSGNDRMWSWWPTWYELRTHYFFDIGFLACSSQTFGATVFWISGFTALPPILNNLSTPAENGVYWLPQVIGGTGFIVSSILFMVEVQPRWYIPAPGVLGWHIGLWNLIGAIGFTLCGALGFGITHPGVEYALTLSTFIGSWAFLIGSVIQWYESLDKYPIWVDQKIERLGQRKS
ncbi:hypothetical protein FPRO03_11231 [Fusarium proliferatum]|nr:hypothetical protein FPRO03_11231 [Fusarium proliferatum]